MTLLGGGRLGGGSGIVRTAGSASSAGVGRATPRGLDGAFAGVIGALGLVTCAGGMLTGLLEVALTAGPEEGLAFWPAAGPAAGRAFGLGAAFGAALAECFTGGLGVALLAGFTAPAFGLGVALGPGFGLGAAFPCGFAAGFALDAGFEAALLAGPGLPFAAVRATALVAGAGLVFLLLAACEAVLGGVLLTGGVSSRRVSLGSRGGRSHAERAGL